ncbi:protein involved in temperature-dependent protein secretion [Caldalkalibacillus uzonensis]|uniref:Protein involved in temperature-dependent protein secretion n=1 Tax=Caldalkalibacillus uzonensis TaxID=353224 RepID=A0ABU0CY22_9BACI|nr:hypothetical protein [Caldalkalibacillus uzonensis]MDQ0341041.1 protein involved in temperature-dependent protein secretion [Caldalkalibacillus uzonensis]
MAGKHMQKVAEGFITFVDETGRMKTLLARNGTFSIVEEVSDREVQEIFDHIISGRYRWLKYGQKRKAGVINEQLCLKTR